MTITHQIKHRAEHFSVLAICEYYGSSDAAGGWRVWQRSLKK